MAVFIEKSMFICLLFKGKRFYRSATDVFQLEQLPGFVLQKKRENQSEVKVEKLKCFISFLFS